MLTLDKIYHAAYVLKDVVRKTSLVKAPKINPDCEVYLKTENLQVTGSFKVRGAGYMISQLTEEEKANLLGEIEKIDFDARMHKMIDGVIAFLNGNSKAITDQLEKDNAVFCFFLKGDIYQPLISAFFVKIDNR